MQKGFVVRQEKSWKGKRGKMSIKYKYSFYSIFHGTPKVLINASKLFPVAVWRTELQSEGQHKKGRSTFFFPIIILQHKEEVYVP